MAGTYQFDKTELLKYRQIPIPKSGGSYVLAMGTVLNRTGLRYKDYALRAKRSRDGLEAVLFDEDPVRALKSDRDLHWTLTDEGDGTVSLYSEKAEGYLTLDKQGARLSRKKQRLTMTANGTTYRFSAADGDKPLYLRCTDRDDTPYGYNFTSGTDNSRTSFVLLERLRGIPAKTEGKKELTVGSVSDIHIDYNVQNKAPYLRKSVYKAARAYRCRYDLDALMTCGDNTSDNGSYPIYNRGVLQGKWPRAKFLSIQNALNTALRRSFRNPENAKNIFWLSGNHDCQVGDRQPEGQRFNSNDYSPFLPDTVINPLIKPAPMDVGIQEELLCYEVRVKGVPFLVLNTPLYPFAPADPRVPNPHRPAPGHTLEQAEWLEERLNDIEKEMGNKAVVFVLSHYPFHRGCFISHNPLCKSNTDAYVALDKTLNRYPNLFWCYGHVHGEDDWITHTRTGEMAQTHAPVEMSLNEREELICTESPDRGNFRSDIILGTGFKSLFVGSLAYFQTTYFMNDGKRFNSGLTDIEVPFSQGIVAEVYEDRVVFTMENFGTKEETALIRGGKYKIRPIIYPRIK